MSGVLRGLGPIPITEDLLLAGCHDCIRVLMGVPVCNLNMQCNQLFLMMSHVHIFCLPMICVCIIILDALRDLAGWLTIMAALS